jgi:hypothetical protein
MFTHKEKKIIQGLINRNKTSKFSFGEEDLLRVYRVNHIPINKIYISYYHRGMNDLTNGKIHFPQIEP